MLSFIRLLCLHRANIVFTCRREVNSQWPVYICTFHPFLPHTDIYRVECRKKKSWRVKRRQNRRPIFSLYILQIRRIINPRIRIIKHRLLTWSREVYRAICFFAILAYPSIFYERDSLITKYYCNGYRKWFHLFVILCKIYANATHGYGFALIYSIFQYCYSRFNVFSHHLIRYALDYKGCSKVLNICGISSKSTLVITTNCQISELHIYI